MDDFEEETVSTGLPQARGFRSHEIKDIGTLVNSVRKIAESDLGLWIRHAQIEVVDTEFMEPIGNVVVTTDESENVEVTFHPHVNHYN